MMLPGSLTFLVIWTIFLPDYWGLGLPAGHESAVRWDAVPRPGRRPTTCIADLGRGCMNLQRAPGRRWRATPIALTSAGHEFHSGTQAHGMVVSWPIGSKDGTLVSALAAPDSDETMTGELEDTAIISLDLRPREDLLDELEVLRREIATLKDTSGDEENTRVRAALNLVRWSESREKSLEDKAQNALRASEQKTMFLANISHELRTPLNGIIGMATLLAERDLDEVSKDYAGMLRDSGHQLLQIINDILDFSKLESGRLQVENEPFDVWTTVEEVVRMFAIANERPQVRLSLHIEPVVPRRILGDELRLRQVVTNFCSNAAKFTSSGRIQVTLSTLETQTLRIEVADTGCGIALDAQKALFQPFTQADSSTTRHFGGTGLGLAICRQLAQAMGGSVDFESKPKHGSRFWLDLPLRVDKSRTRPLTERPISVACISIDQDFRREVKAHVEWMGFQALFSNDVMMTDSACVWLLDMESRSLPPEPWRRLLEERGDTIVLVAANREGLTSEWREEFPASQVMAKPILPSSLVSMCAQAVVNGPVTESFPIPPVTLKLARRLDVLLVEDNPINRRVALAMLEGFDCRVSMACHGQEAVEAMMASDFDVVLMDCQMPVMDGYCAAQAIRALDRESARSVPIIALTAQAMPQDRQRCMDAGMDDYLSKPLSRNGLFEALRPIAATS
ncbi:MAG: response regulator [Planctomycetes bacterium]|nr:response regulator [Planctomycetota bacterium]